MKKEWLNPELSNLGMKNTNEESNGMKIEPRSIWKCKYCGMDVFSSSVLIQHEGVCAYRPIDPVPVPTLS